MMDKSCGKLTVYFEEPFWVGVFERITDGKLSVRKVTFGAEPKDYDVLDFVLRHYHDLKFSPAQERPKANGAQRDRYEVSAGAPAATGGNEERTPSEQP